MSATASDFPTTFDPLSYASRASTRTAQRAMTVDEIGREIIATAELPLAQARTLPAQAYTSEDFFEWEVTHVLRAGWQGLAHISQIPKPGDFLNIDLLGEPLIVVHGKDGEIRVLSRVCPHRAMDIMPKGFGYGGHGPAEPQVGSVDCGHTRIFLCPYHAWTFELDGKLKGCPEMHEAQNFARDSYGLKSFRSEIWNGFIFVNFDKNAPHLAAGLKSMAEDVAAFRFEDLQLVVSREWDCPFNWKVLVENFMESYHHLGIHHKTLQPMMPARDTWTEEERRFYIRAHLPYKESVRDEYEAFAARGDFSKRLPPVEGLNAEQKSEWGLFLISPTFLLATAPDRVIWYRLQPLGANRLKLLTTTLVPRKVAEGPNFFVQREGAAKSLTEFHLEDMEVCTAVQRGLYASGWQQGRLSHLEMPVWLFQRFLAARLKDAWPTDLSTPAPSQHPR
jgi:phenylpropionate dioxygenase-like ring-hydroxylating dioxygenase large terminal subunit